MSSIGGQKFRGPEGEKRPSDDLTGESLIAAMRMSPDRDIDLEARRALMPVRDVDL